MDFREHQNLIAQYQNWVEESQVILGELGEICELMADFIYEHKIAIDNKSQSQMIFLLTFITSAMAKCRNLKRKLAAVLPEDEDIFRELYTGTTDVLDKLEKFFALVASNVKDNKALQLVIAEVMMREADVENLQ